MATEILSTKAQILSTKGSYDFHRYTNIDIPTVESDPNVASNLAVVGSRQHAHSSETFHIDRTQEFPLSCPDWVLYSDFMNALLADGSVTVQLTVSTK